MELKRKVYPESRFGGYTNIDGTIAFYLRVNALLDPAATVIDVGCGRGAYGEDAIPIRRGLRILKGKARRVIGLDVDPAGESNPYIDEFRLLQGDRWPLEDACAGMVVTDSVLEHVEKPGAFFGEARRVLEPRGFLCIRTPNLWNYVALASRLVPNRSHMQVLKTVKQGTQARDTFPTYYRCNTISAIRRMLAENGFDGVVYGFAPEPGYLAFSSLAYRFGAWIHRHMPGWSAPVIFAYAQKKDA